MKISLISKTSLLFLVFLLLPNFVAAQEAAQSQRQPAISANSEQNNRPVAEAMGEDDRLPFMQDERATNTAESNTGGLLLRTLGAMLLIVGLIFFGAWGLRKFGVNFGLFQTENAAKSDAPDLAIIQSVTLGSGRTLSVVRFGERNLLVGSTVHNITLLVDDAAGEGSTAPQPSPPRSRSVADLLAEENNSFAAELNFADTRLSLFDNKQI